MKPGVVNFLRRHEAEPAHGLDTGGDSEQRGTAIAFEAFAGGQHRRHDHGAAMHRATLERVVEILAVRRRAVDHRRIARAERTGVTDRRAGATRIDARRERPHVVAAPRGDAKAPYVYKKV